MGRQAQMGRGRQPIITARKRSIPACTTGHMTKHYISSCIGDQSQLVTGQYTGNIKCMMGQVTWYPPWAGTPPRQAPPWAGTPRQAHPLDQVPPRPGTPPDQYPWTRHSPGQGTLQTRHPPDQAPPWTRHPPRYRKTTI